MKKRKLKKVTGFQLYLIISLSSAILILLFLVIFKTAISNWLLNFFITYEAAQIENGEPKENLIEKIFSPRENRVNPPLQYSSPRSSASIPLQGSFTELFSGVGWRNPVNSNVYQDFKTLTISFPPDYEWEEISNIGPTSPIGPIGDTITVGSRTFKGEVEKIGENYEGHLYELINGEAVPLSSVNPLFSSQYSGKIVLGSDGPSKLFLLYAAYEGKAFEIAVGSAVSVTKDYSSIFNARVTEEGDFNPKVIYKDGAWWISSRLASAEATASAAKLLRIRDGFGTDFTPLLLGNASQFEFFPASGENELYGVLKTEVGGSYTYRFRDLGFKRSDKLVWESLRLNAWEGEVVRGRFTRIDAGSDGGQIKYFLSNDGGKNWEEAELNKFVQFQEKGGDFRWRAELYSSNDQYSSPWIKTIGVEYYIIRN